MDVLKPRYSPTEFTQRGQAIYEREIREHVKDEDTGKFVAIDIETGAYEIHSDDFAATEHLLQRQPSAQIWLCRVGHRTTYGIGGHPSRRQS